LAQKAQAWQASGRLQATPSPTAKFGSIDGRWQWPTMEQHQNRNKLQNTICGSVSAGDVDTCVDGAVADAAMEYTHGDTSALRGR